MLASHVRILLYPLLGSLSLCLAVFFQIYMDCHFCFSVVVCFFVCLFSSISAFPNHASLDLVPTTVGTNASCAVFTVQGPILSLVVFTYPRFKRFRRFRRFGQNISRRYPKHALRVERFKTQHHVQ